MPTQRGRTLLLINHTWLAAELRELGHCVITAGWAFEHFDICFQRSSTIDEILRRLPSGTQLDGIIYFDDSHAPSVLGLEEVNIPTTFYSVDTHHHFKWHRYFGAIFDRVLTAQCDYLQYLALPEEDYNNCPRLAWLPLWAPFDLEPVEPKTIDVCFRGTLDPTLHPQRVAFFDELRKFVPLDAATGSLVDAYPQAKIVINQAVLGDLNFRVFEAMMAGALLITPATSNGLNELFEVGVDLVTYLGGDPASAVERIQHYLAADVERKAIAERGRNKVLAKHTAARRAEDLLKLLPTAKLKDARCRFYGAASSALMSLTFLLKKREIDASKFNAEHLRLLEWARLNLLRSANYHEFLHEDFRSAVFLTKYYLEKSEQGELARNFSQSMHEAYPQDVLLALNYLDDLVRSGQEMLARAVSEQLTDKPDELLQLVPQLLDEAREKVFAASLQ